MPRDKNIFTLNPTSLDMKRSVFNRNSQHKTSFNLGELIPIYLDEILPGDTVSLDLAHVIRMGTPIAPIMDNIYADVYFFFVPNRLVWEHWQQFCGENDATAWTQTTPYAVPQCNIGMSAQAIERGDIGDYFGLPVKDNQVRTGFDGLPNTLKVSELPLRAYYKIYNDWFRDENSIGPKLYTIGDSVNTNIHYYDAPAKVSRFHDLFSSCLPAPQKGGGVTVPLGTIAPLKTGDSYDLKGNLALYNKTLPNASYMLGSYNDQDSEKHVVGLLNNVISTEPGVTVDMTNLYADLSNATAATINQLRTAFQVQKLLEKDARGGTRYIELLKAHFGVTSPDARLQRSEYLAGHRFRINVDQVLATTDTTGTGSQGLGQTGAYSKTSGAGSMFTKSFVEHGMLIGFVVLRQDHTYSQGLDRFWVKKDRFDFYYPVLANIGEVPVFKYELNCRLGSSGVIDGVSSTVFGYQEAWYDYRYKPSRCTSYMNPIVANSLNYWTLGDAYSSVPSLNSSFLEESVTFLDRALKVQSSSMDQFIADFYFKAKYSRVMPLYSIPGLIDHH